MAYSNGLKSESFVASSDLSGAQYHIVDLTAAFKVDAAAANKAFGVLQNKPQAGEHATVAIGGTTKVAAGAAVAVGDLITSAASGWAAVVASGNAADKAVIGRAMTAAASGSVFSMLIDKFSIVRTGGLPI